MRVSLCVDPGRSWPRVLELAERADSAGWHAVYVCDHFMPHDAVAAKTSPGRPATATFRDHVSPHDPGDLTANAAVFLPRSRRPSCRCWPDGGGHAVGSAQVTRRGGGEED